MVREREEMTRLLDMSTIDVYIDVMAGKPSTVLREIKQKKPFASRRQEAFVALFRTADQVRSVVAKVLEPHGITPQQYNVLRILRGSHPQGLPTLEIAERMVERTPGITRLLDRLEAKGLVRRERCPEDRRQVLCWATHEALVLLAELDTPVLEADEEALQNLSRAEVDQLIELLDKIRAEKA